MFEYTSVAIKKIMKEINYLTISLNVLVIWSNIAYLIYSCFVGMGNIYANIVICATALGYFVFYILKIKKMISKNEISVSQHIYKIIKLTANALVLLIAIYGIIIGTVSNASAIKTYLLLVLWLIQAMLELLVFAVETRLEMLYASFSRDAAIIVRLIDKNAIIPAKDNPYIQKLEPLVEEARKQKAVHNTTKKQAKIQNFKDKFRAIFNKK